MNILQRQDEIENELASFEDWADRCAYIIALGSAHPCFSDAKRIEANQLKGCKTVSWAIVTKNNEIVDVKLDSSSILMRGILALLQRIIDGCSVIELENYSVDFLSQIDFGDVITDDRQQGLSSIINTICERLKQS